MTLGNYRIIKELGRGGMGTVYSAEHIVLGRMVAVKVLHESRAREADACQRFLLEARAVAQLRNPHIVDVTDFGQGDDGRIFFVMELLEGEMLADTLMREGSIPLFRALTILRQITQALCVAHDRGLVHRDLKPDNIHLERRIGRREIVRVVRDGETPRFVVEPEGEFDFVRIIDFGIAKFREMADDPDEALGTPLYMAPEQIRAEGIDHRTDLYALGILFYEMLTGQPPFLADTVEEVTRMHLIEPPPLPRLVRPDLHIPEAAECLILRALSKDQDRRHQSAREFLDDLQGCFSDRFYRRDARFMPEVEGPPVQAGRHTGELPVAPSPARERRSTTTLRTRPLG